MTVEPADEHRGGLLNAVRRAVFVAAIPVNAVVALWVIAGASLWPPVSPSGVDTLRFVVGPFMVVAMTVSTLLMFVQQRAPIRLSAGQAWLQIALWMALFTLGLTFPALAEDHGGASILLRIIGEHPVTAGLSGLLWTASFVAAWALGVGLMALLIVGIDPKRQRLSASPPSPQFFGNGNAATPPPSPRRW